MKRYADRLGSGESVSFRPHGNSMRGRINDGDLVTLEPAVIGDVEVGDAVMCKVNSKYYLHLVTAKRDGQVQISNNLGHVNGWTSKVFGKVTKVSK